MAGFDLTPEEEKQLERELAQVSRDFSTTQSRTSPVLAQNVAEFNRRFPYANPEVLVPTVQAFSDGRMTEYDAVTFLENLTNTTAAREIQEKKQGTPKKKSWWERNVTDKLKTGSRWAMAGLNFVPQAVTNLAAMGYQAGKTVREEGWDSFGDAWSREGFIISTDLGTMLENDEVSGQGFFIGDRAAELQAARARRTRGSIAGMAFTPGRATALVFSQPGSKEFNRISGIVDAGFAIATPSVPGGKAVTAGLKYGTEVAASKVGFRSLAGLRGYESAHIAVDKVTDFLNSKSGRSVVKRMTKINTIDDAIEAFPTADVAWLKNVAEITDETAMRKFINDSVGLGDATLGTAPRSVEDWNISRWDTFKNNAFIQRESLVSRYMASVPGRHVVLAGGSEREKLEAVKNVKNYLRTLRVDQEERKQLVDSFARAIADDDGSMRNVVEQIDAVVRRSFKQMNVDDRLVNEMLKGISSFRNAYDSSLYGAISNKGDSTDFKGIYTAIVDGKVVETLQPLNTAGLQTEMLRHSLMLPDPRQTRRIMSKIGGRITGKAGPIDSMIFDPLKRGEQRLPFAMVEAIQNQIWRPLTLMTGGYVLRNMADSLLRQSFNPAVRTGVFHPFELIMVAAFKRYKGDVLGGSFKGTPEQLIRSGQRDLAEVAGATLRESRDPASRASREQKTGVWKLVRREQGDNEFMGGVAAELALLSGDEAARLAALGETANGLTLSQTVASRLAADPQKKYIRELQNRWKNRTVTLTDGEKTTATVEFLDASGNVNMKNLETYVEQYIIPRVETVTGNSQKLIEIVGTGRVTDDLGNQIDVFNYDEMGRVSGYVEDALFRQLKKVIDDPNVTLKEFYKTQEMITSVSGQRSGALGQMMDAWDRATDTFFSELYPKREAWLNRSPVFRQYYYDSVGRMVDSMDEQQVGRMIENITNVAAEQGVKFGNERTARIWIGKYVGSSDLADKMFDIKNGAIKTGGTWTVDQVDAFAKGYALDETKRLFYNASEKSNFADILRVIVPFGSAWAEVTKKWVGMLSSDPEVLKRVGVTVQGLQEADPDGDGKGFFYKDPNTGEYQFNYPFSDQLAPLIMGLGGAVTGGIALGAPGALIGGAGAAGAGVAIQSQLEGLDTTFTAPLKSLSMGMSIIPGVGPYVQVAAGRWLQDKPDLDYIAKVLMPYGTPDVSFVTAPSWVKKIAQAITANPETDRLYADIKVDVARVLSASGKYDLTTEQGKLDLEKDAGDRARWLLVLQGVGQFTGPTRPSPEFTVPTKQGNVTNKELTKAWYDIRTNNPNNSVEVFLETFGDDAFMYTQGSTVSSSSGLDASREFGLWESDNEDLFAKYPEVAAFFAPVGSTFDYRVYVRQLESGKRQRLSVNEILDEAQARIGIAMYRRVRRRIGPNPTDEQDAMLRSYREELGTKYPGFRNRVLDIKAEERRINALREAANDPSLERNPVADALRIYLDYRDQAIARANELGVDGLSGKKASDLREILRQVGEELSVSTPEFERLWDQILYREIDLL